MNPHKLLITLLLLLFYGNAIQAQVAKDFVYVDSSLMYPDAKDTIPAPTADEEQEDTVSAGIKYTVDTSLIFNDLSLSGDSIRLLKKCGIELNNGNKIIKKNCSSLNPLYNLNSHLFLSSCYLPGSQNLSFGHWPASL